MALRKKKSSKGVVLKPNSEPQTRFLESPADICLYGGSGYATF